MWMFLGIVVIAFIVVAPIALIMRSTKQAEEIKELKQKIEGIETSGFFKAQKETFYKTQNTETIIEHKEEKIEKNEKIETPFYEDETAPVSSIIENEKEETSVLVASIRKFIRGGNLWAAGGVILLTSAFAMLIAFLARRGFFTVEIGIALSALCGLLMIAAGWFFKKIRESRRIFFLLLQGGGIGILYLSVFASHKLTLYFPAHISLILMSLLMIPAIVLALFQNSQILALFGFLGGFAAPILLASGSGNHIFLFSYYTLLNTGILSICFYRLKKKASEWKMLNITAFFCSFIAFLAWTFLSYEKTLFVSAEIFSLVFLFMFTLLGIQSLKNSRINYFDIIVITLTPILSAVIQWKLVSHISHGYAIISILFSVFYITTVVIILRLRDTFKFDKKTTHSIMEGYLGLAVLLANMAIPLELSPEATSAIWSAEGAVILLIGLRLQNRKIQISAFVVHIASSIASRIRTGDSYEYFFRSPQFIGSKIIALSAMVMALLLHKNSKKTRLKTEILSPLLIIWAYIWWFTALFFASTRFRSWYPSFGNYFRNIDPSGLFLFLSSLSAVFAYGISRFFRSWFFRIGIIPSMFTAVVLLPRIFYDHSDILFAYNFFQEEYLWILPLFFAIEICLLFVSGKERLYSFSRKDIMAKIGFLKIHVVWIFIFILMSLVMVTSSARAFAVHHKITSSWTYCITILPSLVFLFAMAFLTKLISSIYRVHKKLLLYVLPLILSCVLGLYFIVTLFLPGDSKPLPYIPVLNPLELMQVFCIIIILFWVTQNHNVNSRKINFVVSDIAVFLWITGIIARSVHFYADISMNLVSRSSEFHLGIFIFWALYGILHIIAGNKIKSRPVWIAGTVLTIVDVAKLLLLDLADSGTVTRIVSFFIAGIVLLFIGWRAPLPPERIKNAELGK
jgi:uncharacterized membrane protein